MKVQVDADRCEGHGRCYALAPTVFEPDEIGNAEVHGDGSVSPADENRARLAVANCPEQAISIEEGS
jgi:ferredoxin